MFRFPLLLITKDLCVFDSITETTDDGHNVEIESIRKVSSDGVVGVMVFAIDMSGKKDCPIVNISSVAAFIQLTKIPAYSAAKAALANFTKWLAFYFA